MKQSGKAPAGFFIFHQLLYVCIFQMQECSNRLGIPMNYIFPVKNYHEEIDTEDDMDVLILKALDQIVHIAADAMKKKCFNSGGNHE